jgi:hypothetical protein
LQTDTAHWQDKFVCEAFKVNTGYDDEKTLHREQSFLLKRLLGGENIAVSAPTSFGKSFVIDAFITIKKPKTIVIIVPTLALTDETRRRLCKKFANMYKIITTSDAELSENNIFIFPQERAVNYIGKIKNIDILIIDEFYKAGIAFDKERAPILLKAILNLGKIAKQRYFLAPNISNIENNPFTEGMEFLSFDFNTVFSEVHKCYEDITTADEVWKGHKLLEIINTQKTKSLIYAGTYQNIEKIATILNENLPNKNSNILISFSDWIKTNYSQTYILSDIVRKGTGIHNGQLHRSLTQIQVKLFEDDDGLDNIVSTSSIIEGVNTSAENVIIWANKNGNPPLNYFTYKNIVGRGGRMFRSFIGKVYLLEAPPQEESTQLKLEITDDLLNTLNNEEFKAELTKEQIFKMTTFNGEMDTILGENVYQTLIMENSLQTSKPNCLKNIAVNMKNNPKEWNGFEYLNSNNPDHWDRCLFLTIKQLGHLGMPYTKLVAFIKAIANSWTSTIPQIISSQSSNELTIEDFFKLERDVTFKVSSLLKDINTLYNHIFGKQLDISPFISKLSHAFLPRLVYELEEYGLPRMLSKKIQLSSIINLENNELSVHDLISQFKMIGLHKLKQNIKDLHTFEDYILSYFYDGIS